jgi:hypothetical protein
MRPLLAALLLLPAGAPDEGARWIREYWSISRRQGNGAVTHRVNSPDVAAGRFKDRPEAKADGKLALSIREEPADLAAAELYLELWGGHPGVARKRFTLNGGSSTDLPEAGAAAKNCTYTYPSVALRLEDLRKGENVFQFSCDAGSTFWGHFLFEIACLRVSPKRAPFEFAARVLAEVRGESVELALQADPDRIDRVEYHARYRGYDENGDGAFDDWHGMTKEGKPLARAAQSAKEPFAASWDLSMLPDQKEASVRAVVHFRDDPGLCYVTAPVTVPFPPRAGRSVSLQLSRDLPRPFWSRAGRLMKCTIDLDCDPAAVERAELHVALWDGGRGKTAEPFLLNGRALPVAGDGRHDLLYRVVPVDPAWLLRGPNEVRLLSDTEHHGIEVLLPGPALVVRARK